MAYLAIETGGTKVVCRAVVETGVVLGETHFPTGRPEDVIDSIDAFVNSVVIAPLSLRSIGLASFGPIVLDSRSPQYGMMLATSKSGWAGFNLRDALAQRFSVPVAVDTDVNAAALAEQILDTADKHGAVAYVTVGTGIGAGLCVHGQTLRGGNHPEIGHLLLQRDPSDKHPSSCPFHENCAEGLTAGPSLNSRSGDLTFNDAADVQALAIEYIGQLCAMLVLAWSPERIVMGGGVIANNSWMIPEVERAARTRLNGYGLTPAMRDYPLLAASKFQHAGLEGALLMARRELG